MYTIEIEIIMHRRTIEHIFKSVSYFSGKILTVNCFGLLSMQRDGTGTRAVNPWNAENANNIYFYTVFVNYFLRTLLKYFRVPMYFFLRKINYIDSLSIFFYVLLFQSICALYKVTNGFRLRGKVII